MAQKGDLMTVLIQHFRFSQKQMRLCPFLFLIWNALSPAVLKLERDFVRFFCLFVSFVLFVILGQHPWHMEVPRLRMELEL